MSSTENPYASCLLCPRRCAVNRLLAAAGRCGESARLRLAAASIHRGEEPPIGGGGGSGTIFVTGCNLGCGFCQNYQISRDGLGRAVSPGEFAAITLALRGAGAENINIVTGSHAVPAIVRGLDLAREQGLDIPVLWNSSAYETEGALDLLRDRVDVYLPDLKTLDPQVGSRFFRAPDYPQYAEAAILNMLSSHGEPRWNNPAEGRSGGGGGPGEGRPAAQGEAAGGAAEGRSGPLLARGVIIRHLIIPGYLESTRQVILWFARHARGRALLSLMTQYTPPAWNRAAPREGPEAPPDAGPQRHLIREEYERVMEWLTEAGIDEGFYQEPVTGRDWLPDFTRPNPFPSRLSRPVWHWTSPVPDKR